MPKYDVLNEAVIDSPPIVVYKAILNEHAGVTHWWMPILEFKLKGDVPIDHEGAIVVVTINPKSRIRSAKFSAKVAKIVEAESIEYEVSGDFVGTGKWTFEPADGKTKVQYRINFRLKRLSLILLSPFVDIGKKHSEVIQKGFKACNSYLGKK